MINKFNEIADLAGVNRIEPKGVFGLGAVESHLANQQVEQDLELARNIVIEEDEHWFEEYFLRNVAENVNKDNFYDAYEGWVENLTLEQAQLIASKRPETSEEMTERIEKELLAKSEPLDMSGACGTGDR